VALARGLQRGARRGAKVLAAAADVLHPRARGAVVLVYHRVGGRSASEIDLPAGDFASQMELLAGSGRVTTLDGALAALDGVAPEDADTDPVVVTFDDGTADFVDDALPVLVRHRVPALLYLATDFVESQRPFPNDGAPLSWAALRDALGTGLVTIGSHTHTHALLDRVAPAVAADELDRSRDLVQERLGTTCEHFAYPKAVPGTDAADAAVRARFRTAALGGTHANPYGRTDPHRVARSPVLVSDGDVWFRRKLAGGMGLEDTLRRTVNRYRYAGATT
jgi:peptidoglycan/xylan/chitin deacetylase (PgdA/CDA1 family)